MLESEGFVVSLAAEIGFDDAKLELLGIAVVLPRPVYSPDAALVDPLPLPVRQMAAELFSQGVGGKGVASALGLPEKTVEGWLYTHRALGKEALFVTTHKKYSHELKVAAARDVVENGMTRPDVTAKYGIASLSPLDGRCRAYRNGGPDALLPKPKGRPRKPGKPEYASREEELEARVRELELELEIQKRINALADGIGRK